MDIQSLLTEAKARFAHNSAKDYLREKYKNKFLVADQNGLWAADTTTITFLQSFDSEKVILLDTHNRPVEVDRLSLLDKLKSVYQENMVAYLKEFKETETKR
jgi:hypothetical protein